MCAQPLIPQPSLHPLLERGQGGETHRRAKGVKHTGEMQIGPLAMLPQFALFSH